MAEPYRTSETRWFFQGEIPKAVNEWFLTGLPGDTMNCPQVEREDLYLLAADRGDIGLKYRQDSLQLKLRGDSHPFSLADDRIKGVIGDWQRFTWVYDKESFDLAQICYAPDPTSGRRIAVEQDHGVRKAYQSGSRESRASRAQDLRRMPTPLPLLVEIHRGIL